MSLSNQDEDTYYSMKSSIIHSEPHASTSTPHQEHVTVRRGKMVINASTSNTFSLLSDDESDTQILTENCTLHRSCPELNTFNRHDYNEMSHKITKLETELASAHNEIENLTSENITLKQLNDVYKSQIQQLTQLCKSSVNTPSSGKKTQSLIHTKLNCSIDRNEKYMEKPDSRKQNKIIENVCFSQNKGKDLTVSTRKTLASTKADVPGYHNIKASIITTQKLDGLKRDVASSCINKTTEIMNAKNAKVIILADQQGKGVQQNLQKLLGSTYDVLCFWKPGATLPDVLSSYKLEISNLTQNDFVILIGNVNDDSPFVVKYMLTSWLYSTQNTNVIVCETPYNKFLNVEKLNHELKFICSNFKHVEYLCMSYDRYFPPRREFSVFLCRNILKEILRLCCRNNFESYQSRYKSISSETTNRSLTDRSTQTETDTQFISLTTPLTPIRQPAQTSNNSNNKKDFFRI